MSSGVDRLRRYEDSSEFFSLNGSVTMRLTREAAIEVCARAVSQGRVVSRIEGGIWRDPYFEERLDCIWGGVDPPATKDVAERNNMEAQDFIKSSEADVFLITAPAISGE